jgi:bacterioferritin-associated ferredoxin
MDPGMVSDEVTDAIASIEMHRQVLEKEAGLAAACSEALRKLHELLEHERAAQQPQGAGTRHPANVEAVTIEIKRIQKMAGVRSQAPPRNPRPGQHQVTLRNGTRIPPRNKGRRTMGRRGDR